MATDLTPLKPIDDRQLTDIDRDHAKRDGYSLTALEDLLSDCHTQPDWREKADRAHAFYDMGKQLTHEEEHKIRRDWGIEPIQTNLIHGVINGVLGQEAKARSDIRVEADDDEYADISDVFSVKLKEAQRESNADMAVSNAYAGQVKGGIGWVEVSRASDPLDYPYRVKDIHRGDIWWDMEGSTDIGLDDARWQIRARWMDLDEAVAMMPEHKELLKSAVNGWDFNVVLPDEQSQWRDSAWTRERYTKISRDEWCDSNRKRIKFYEVWYRVPATVAAIQLSPTRRVIYDQTNPMHREGIARGMVKVVKTVTRQVRMALFAGPHRLMDIGTTRRKFPYIPFFAFRDDDDRSPYGLVEGMISPQREYNQRRQMINWALVNKQLLMDDDALNKDFNTINDIVRTINRPDFVAVLNANRRNANGMQMVNNLAMQPEQIEVMQDAKQLIQDVPKIYSSQLGNAPAGVTSGIANSLLIEQGIVAMGELNDNYRYARRAVFDQVLDLIAEDHYEEEMKVTIGSGQQRRVVVLNTWNPETGAPLNRVKDAPVKVGLSDVPSSPAFRMQEQQQLATMIQALGTNPQALAVLAPAYIEGSSLANRQQLADDLRRATGVPLAGDRQAQAQAQQMAQQAAQQNQQLDAAKKQAEVKKLEAEAELTQAKTIELTDKSHLALRTQAMNEETMGEDEDSRIKKSLSRVAV